MKRGCDKGTKNKRKNFSKAKSYTTKKSEQPFHRNELQISSIIRVVLCLLKTMKHFPLIGAFMELKIHSKGPK